MTTFRLRILSVWCHVALGCVLAILLPAGLIHGESQPEFADANGSREGIEWFEANVRPVLIEHCYECHSAETSTREAELELDTRTGLRRGGERGPIIVPGKPSESLLVRALNHAGPEMPPDQRLAPKTIRAFEKWIEMGAPSPADTSVPSEATGTVKTSIDWDQARQTWAFQPPRVTPNPVVANASWPRRDHDFFVLQELEARDGSPAPPASRNVLARRLALDITGLPLSRSQFDRYVSNQNGTLTESELESLVEELLSSPHFGEHWARMWLDLARYAEDQAHIVGNNKSLFYPNAYLYRDWVIAAFNRDLPYDDFVRLQLAADLMDDVAATDLAALGFLGLGPKYYDRKRLEVKAEEWEDRVDTVSRTLLGLTVACARCHDHKYDPITSVDYYAMASVFASTSMHNRPLHDSVERSGAQAKLPEEAMHVVREGKPTDLSVFVRGDVNARGAKSHRGLLTILSTGNQPIHFESGSGRLELANQIVRTDNPLTARVYVNRVWGKLIGKPIVGTPSNFGQLGQTASHPKLLDNLALRFIEQKWSLKWLVKEIVTSATYRQSSSGNPAWQQSDPENAWLSRMNRKRLTVEEWRDSMLAASGQLSHVVGGTSIDPTDVTTGRRTLYSAVSRFQVNPLLASFDFPDPNVHSAARAETITPQQRLIAMNHPLVIHQAELLSQNAVRESTDFRSQVSIVYQRLFARDATEQEQRLAHEFVMSDSATPTDGQPDPRAGDHWIQFVHALLASNEMLFLD